MEISVSLILNIEGFIGLSSCFHSSTYENHMCKRKYNKFEAEVSFTEYQNDALVTIPDESVMEDFITMFFCFQLFCWYFIEVCPCLSAMCSLPTELSVHRVLWADLPAVFGTMCLPPGVPLL